MANLEELIRQVAQARQQFITVATDLSPEQASFKSSPETWSVTENVEHMVWAEQGGINGIWKAIAGIMTYQPVWTGDAVHHGLSIRLA